MIIFRYSSGAQFVQTDIHKDWLYELVFSQRFRNTRNSNDFLIKLFTEECVTHYVFKR